jgi:hypothetical protein
MFDHALYGGEALNGRVVNASFGHFDPRIGLGFI